MDTDSDMCTRDSIMGLSVLWRMTTVHASKGNSSLESVATAIESSRDRKIYRSPIIEMYKSLEKSVGNH